MPMFKLLSNNNIIMTNTVKQIKNNNKCRADFLNCSFIAVIVTWKKRSYFRFFGGNMQSPEVKSMFNWKILLKSSKLNQFLVNLCLLWGMRAITKFYFFIEIDTCIILIRKLVLFSLVYNLIEVTHPFLDAIASLASQHYCLSHQG